MKWHNGGPILRIPLGVVLAIIQFGCSSSNAPPPAIAVSVSPATAMVQASGTQQFTPTVANDPADMGVSWTVSCSAAPCGQVSPTSTLSSVATTYTAPSTPPLNNLTVTLTAKSVSDPTKSTVATITVPGISVSISPATATVQNGGTLQFTATVSNDAANGGVTWSLSCQQPAQGSVTCGTLSATSTPSGTAITYTASIQSNVEINKVAVTITAASVTNPSKSAAAQVTVNIPIVVSILPGQGLTRTNGSIAVWAQIQNTTAGVTWSITGCSGGASVCGTLYSAVNNISCTTTNTGYCANAYNAPAAAPPGGQVMVTATSIADPTVVATATIVISPINLASADYPAGNAPVGVVVADFNHDGKLDLAVADDGNFSTGDNGAVSILLGNGDGTFQPAQLVNAGNNPAFIAAGDFNGDGKPDLVVSDASNVAVLLGNGDGTFQSPLIIGAGVAPSALALGDFNGDGKLDIAVTDIGSSSGNNGAVYILLGNGDGTFQSPVLLNAGNSSAALPVAIVARDFNGDGKLDLAVATTANVQPPGSEVSILLGNGDGSFQAPVFYPIDQIPTSLAAGDFRGNGKVDLALTTYLCGAFGTCGSLIQALQGNGDGTFQASQNVTLTHADGTGLGPPIELSDCSALGTSNWQGIGICYPQALQVADFDGSGKAGLVGIGEVDTPSGGGVFVIPGNGDGTFEGILGFPGIGSSLAVGDFNGNGKPDIVVANTGANDVVVLLNQTP